MASTVDKGNGRVEVQWSSAFSTDLCRRARAYVVTVAVANREWIALTRDSSVKTIQLDTVSLGQADGSVTVQICDSVMAMSCGRAYLVDEESITGRWRADDSSLNNGQSFLSQTISRLVPGLLTSLVHWITSMGQN